MTFDKKTKNVFLEITREAIIKEASSLPKITAAETFISTANLAIQQIVGAIAQESIETLPEAVKAAQADIWEILENTRAMVNLCILAERYNDIKEELEE